MINWKKCGIASLTTVSMLAVTACGGSTSTAPENSNSSSAASEQKTVKLQIASVYSDLSAPAKGTQMFADLVKERSNGSIQVDFFPNGSLGSEREIFEGVSSGDLQMVLGGTQGVDMYASEYMFITAPFLFSNMDHLKKVMASDLGKKMFEKMDESNVHILGINYRGARHMTSTKPVKTPEDLSGLKLRLPELEAWVAAWKELGALPTPIALPELYGALQTGVVDASEGPYEQMATFKLQEVQKYVINTAHIYEPTFLWINKGLWDSLSKEQQELLQQAADEAMEFADKEAVTDAEKFYKELQDAGMEVIDPDLDKFIEKAQPALKQFFETKWNVTNLEEINSYK